MDRNDIAVRAMEALIAAGFGSRWSTDELAKFAFKLADAMMREARQ